MFECRKGEREIGERGNKCLNIERKEREERERGYHKAINV